MPVYNEINSIREIVRRVLNVPVLEIHNQKIQIELVIVDDFSSDGTGEILEELRKNHPDHIKVAMHDKNAGKGAAIRTGLRQVTGDILVIQDADLEYSPEDYPVLIKPIIQGVADVVYGSRFLGPHRVFFFWHYVGNKFLTLLTNILYNTVLTDMETGYKAFRTEVFRRFQIKSNQFDFEPEITAKVFKSKLRVYEVPIFYAGRDYSEGKKISWLDAFPAIWALIKFRFFD